MSQDKKTHILYNKKNFKTMKVAAQIAVIASLGMVCGGMEEQKSVAEPEGGVVAETAANGEEVEDGTPDYGAPETRQTRKPGEVPAMFKDDSMLDESLSNQELGINVYTAPSISKIFNQLDDLPAIPDELVLRSRPEKLSTEAGKLAMEMGYLMADGFIAVRSGHMNDIKPIALELVRRQDECSFCQFVGECGKRANCRIQEKFGIDAGGCECRICGIERSGSGASDCVGRLGACVGSSHGGNIGKVRCAPGGDCFLPGWSGVFQRDFRGTQSSDGSENEY